MVVSLKSVLGLSGLMLCLQRTGNRVGDGHGLQWEVPRAANALKLHCAAVASVQPGMHFGERAVSALKLRRGHEDDLLQRGLITPQDHDQDQGDGILMGNHTVAFEKSHAEKLAKMMTTRQLEKSAIQFGGLPPKNQEERERSQQEARERRGSAAPSSSGKDGQRNSVGFSEQRDTTAQQEALAQQESEEGEATAEERSQWNEFCQDSSNQQRRSAASSSFGKDPRHSARFSCPQREGECYERHGGRCAQTATRGRRANPATGHIAPPVC